jgi:MAD, mothers against decapentaplegic interacting protein
MNRVSWCYSTRGMPTVGQDEVVILLERQDDDKTIPFDVFHHLAAIYDDASQGCLVNVSSCSAFGFANFMWLCCAI